MDIAKLGVAIDPAKAIDGGKKIKEVLTEIGSTADTQLKKVDEKARKAGESTKKMGEDGRRGMQEFGRGVFDLLDGLGLMDNAFGNFTRRAIAIASTVQNVRAGLSLLGNAGGDTARGMAAAAVGGSAAAAALTAQAVAAKASGDATRAAGIASQFLATAQTAQAAASTASAGATAAAAAAATAHATAATAAAAGNTALAASATAAMGPMALLATIIQLCEKSLAGLNTKRLGDGKIIDIDAEVVSSVDKLGGGMNQLALRSAAAAPALNAVGAGAGAAGAGAATATAAVSSMGVVVAGLSLALVALIAALTAVGIAFAAFKAGLPKAAEMEDVRVQFAVLLSSFEKADKRIAELQQFAVKTPFNEKEVVEASRILEVFTRGALSTGEALTMVGDAASAARQPFSDVATWVGRLYAGLKGGQPIGEATARLMEMGLLMPETKSKLDKLAETANEGGKKFDELWKMATDSLLRFQGTMDLQSQTWNGKISSIGDAWDQMLGAFAKPIANSLKPFLDDLYNILVAMKPAAAAFGETIASAISILYQAIKDGQLEDLIATTFMAGLETAADFFASVFVGTIVFLGESLGNALGEAADNGANAFMRAFMVFVNWLAEQVNKILAPLTANAEKLGIGRATVIGPIGGFSPVNFFEAGKQKSLGETIAGFQGSNGLVGTTWRDKAGGMAAGLLDKAKKNNPGFNDSDLPPPANPPNGTLDGKGGKKGKEDKSPKAQEVKELDTAVQKLIKDWTDLTKQMDETLANIGKSIADNMTTGIMDVLKGTKDLKTAFADMAEAIINDIIRMVIQMYVQLAVASALAALGYGGSGGAGYSVGGDSYSNAGVLKSHTGGVAGSRKLVSGGISAFHNGGIATAEAMVKVERGETILTRRRASELEDQLTRRQQGGGREKEGRGIQIVNVTDQRQILDVIAANPDAVVNAISKRQPQVRNIVSSKERK